MHQFELNPADGASDDSPHLAGNPPPGIGCQNGGSWPGPAASRPSPSEPPRRLDLDQLVVLVFRIDPPIVFLVECPSNLRRPWFRERTGEALTDDRLRPVLKRQRNPRLNSDISGLDAPGFHAQVKPTSTPDKPQGNEVWPAIRPSRRQPDVRFLVQPLQCRGRGFCDGHADSSAGGDPTYRSEDPAARPPSGRNPPAPGPERCVQRVTRLPRAPPPRRLPENRSGRH